MTTAFADPTIPSLSHKQVEEADSDLDDSIQIIWPANPNDAVLIKSNKVNTLVSTDNTITNMSPNANLGMEGSSFSEMSLSEIVSSPNFQLQGQNDADEENTKESVPVPPSEEHSGERKRRSPRSTRRRVDATPGIFDSLCMKSAKEASFRHHRKDSNAQYIQEETTN